MSPKNSPALTPNILAYLEVSNVFVKLSDAEKDAAEDMLDRLDTLWYAMSSEEVDMLRAYMATKREEGHSDG